ncbi:hypothetical protein B0H21DRAFT_826528 [Amylocystis lapponica]|nr:hypothetical protein B0H21DRAFT_826528 [Amylocystis lapponica]
MSSRTSPPSYPNAPYIHPRDLPPSPQTPTSSLHGHGFPPPAAPRMHPVDLPSASNNISSYGLMTPPSSPSKSAGAGASALHPLLAAGASAMHFLITQPPETIQFRGFPPSALGEPAVRPGVTRVSVNVLGIFLVEVRSARGVTVTVGDVLRQVYEELSHQVQGHELRCFPRDVQQYAMGGAPGVVRRSQLLGPRVLFAGMKLVGAEPNTAHCELELSVA